MVGVTLLQLLPGEDRRGTEQGLVVAPGSRCPSPARAARPGRAQGKQATGPGFLRGVVLISGDPTEEVQVSKEKCSQDRATTIPDDAQHHGHREMPLQTQRVTLHGGQLGQEVRQAVCGMQNALAAGRNNMAQPLQKKPPSDVLHPITHKNSKNRPT